MATTAVEDILSILESAGAGTTTGLIPTLYGSTRAVLPVGDGPYIHVRGSGGLASLRSHELEGATVPVKTVAYQQPTFSVMVHAKSYAEAESTAQAAFDALFQVRNAEVNGVWYVSVTPSQPPFDLGTDKYGRSIVGFNIRVIKRPS